MDVNPISLMLIKSVHEIEIDQPGKKITVILDYTVSGEQEDSNFNRGDMYIFWDMWKVSNKICSENLNYE